jgi:hypothetical protein
MQSNVSAFSQHEHSGFKKDFILAKAVKMSSVEMRADDSESLKPIVLGH